MRHGGAADYASSQSSPVVAEKKLAFLDLETAGFPRYCQSAEHIDAMAYTPRRLASMSKNGLENGGCMSKGRRRPLEKGA